LPKNIYNLNKNFETTKRTIVVSFWAIDIAFVTLCHKIKIINRLLPNKWAMFSFKLACVVGPYFFYEEVEKSAIREQLARVYANIEDDYRKYKNTGNILMLNPNVNIFDIKTKFEQ
jgi:hypothetical protein